jgi:uncharacterized FlaG/YvyC family protein
MTEVAIPSLPNAPVRQQSNAQPKAVASKDVTRTPAVPQNQGVSSDTESTATANADAGASGIQGPVEIQVNEQLKLRVQLDEPTGRFVYLGVDPQSGEVKRQFPPEEALRAIARLRDIAGLAVDKTL